MNMRAGRYVISGVLLVLGCAVPIYIRGGQMQTQNEDDVARQVARDYIQQTKKWKDDEFQIEIIAHKDDNTVVVDAVHVDDLRGEKGSNKSVQLNVDTFNKVVVKELGYQ
jgi:hypothetical protein